MKTKTDIEKFISKDNKVVVIRGKKCLCKTIDIMKYIRDKKISLDGMNGFDIYEVCGDIAYDDLNVDYYNHGKKMGYFIV